MTIYRRRRQYAPDGRHASVLLGTYLYTDSIGSTATVALTHSLSLVQRGG
jgi:hypothetical protein